MASCLHVLFVLPDLLVVRGDVKGRRLRGVGVVPRDRFTQCVVDLERPWAITVFGQAATVPGRQTVAHDPAELGRVDVEELQAGVGHVIETPHGMIGSDLATVSFERAGEGISDRLTPASRDRPPARVREHPEYQPERCRGHPAGGPDHVSCDGREQRTGAWVAEHDLVERVCTQQRLRSEPGRHQQVARDPERSEEVADQVLRMSRGKSEGRAPCGGVTAERLLGTREIPEQRQGGAVSEHLRQLYLGVEPFQSVSAQIHRIECRRGQSGRVHHRAHVVPEAGFGQFARPGSTTDRRMRFEYQNLVTGFGECDRCRQTVGS